MVRLGVYLRFAQGIIVVIAIIIGSRFGIIGVAVSLVVSDIVVIISKVLALTLSVKVSVFTVINRWVVAWRSVLPIMAISIPYMSISHTLIINICYAVAFVIVIICEFVVFPKIVGKEYAESVSPFINKLIGRITKR